MRKLLFALAALLYLPLAAQSQEPPGIRTEHGFRYINHTNKGGAKIQPGDMVSLHFEVFISDSLLSSTREIGPRELVFPPADQLPERVPAVFDAVALSGKGDSVTIYETIDSFLLKFIPPTLQQHKEVRYQIVVVDVTPKAEMEKRAAEEQKAGEAAMARAESVKKEVDKTAEEYRTGQLQEKLTTTASGLKILIVEKGTGAPVAKGEQVKTHYYGVLTDGAMFDNSFERGQPLPFAAGVGQMIPGFDEGAMMLNHGGKAYLFIPSQLAYGEEGAGEVVPPNAELIFYIELL